MFDTRESHRGRPRRTLFGVLGVLVTLIGAAGCPSPSPRPSGSPEATPSSSGAVGTSGVMIAGGSIDGKRSSDRPGSPAPVVPPEEEHETQAPVPISSSTVTTAASRPSGVAKTDAPPAGARSVDFTTYVPSSSGALINIEVPDISGADNADGLAIHTGNRYADVVDGAPVTRVDPTMVFPAPIGGVLCCDQVMIYVPSIERFVWLMQHAASSELGPAGFRLAVASPADVHTNFQTAWTYWDFTGANFGRNGAQFDYPDLAYTDHFLIGTINLGIPELDKDGKVVWGMEGRVVFRIDLTQLAAAAATINFAYVDPADLPLGSYQFSHLAQHGADTALLAGHIDTATIRVLAISDAGNTYIFHDVKVAAWHGQDVTTTPTGEKEAVPYDSTGPDGTNWLARAGASISGAARTGNQLWLAWTANSGKATGDGFDFPTVHVRVATIDLTTWTTTSEMQVWNPDYAFAYPALDTNSAGEVGIIVGWGGLNNHANTAEGIIGDYVVWYHTDSKATPGRFGDYITLRRAGGSGSKFAAFGYFTTGTVSGGFAFTPYYSVFSH
jgi:hypothetical protein